MKVSVIVPIYKVEKYLKECLDSILNQDFLDFEIICVDDCSPDSCEIIVKDYIKHSPNIKYIKNERNSGLSFSRNVGLRDAVGEYVWFVDSDDFIKENSLKRLYNLANSKDLDVIYFNKDVFYEEDYCGVKYKYLNKNYDENTITTGRKMFVDFMKKNTAKGLNAYTQFCRINFLLDNKLFFYEGIVHEDWLFYFYVAMRAERVSQLNEILYAYRVRNNSITNKKKRVNKYSIYVVLFSVLDFWKNDMFTEEEDVAIEKFCEMIYGNCKRYRELYADINDEENNFFESRADKFLYRKLTGIENVILSEDDKDRLKKSNRVLMYGAGRIGLEMVTILAQEGINIDECFVTKLDPVQKNFLGWKLRTIDEMNFKDDYIVIVASKGSNSDAMVDKLKERGVSNYILAAKR